MALESINEILEERKRLRAERDELLVENERLKKRVRRLFPMAQLAKTALREEREELDRALELVDEDAAELERASKVRGSKAKCSMLEPNPYRGGQSFVCGMPLPCKNHPKEKCAVQVIAEGATRFPCGMPLPCALHDKR